MNLLDIGFLLLRVFLLRNAAERDPNGVSTEIGTSNPYPAPLGVSENYGTPINLELQGQYFWQLIFSYNNLNNSGILTKTVSITKTISKSSHSLQKSITDLLIKNHMEASAGGVFKLIDISMKRTLDLDVNVQLESMKDETHNETISTTETTVYQIGPNSSFRLYQLMFRGAGLTYATGTTSSDPGKDELVQIPITIAKQLMLKDIKVVATNQPAERPDDVLRETRGGSADVNSGFGGKYIWLVPVWTEQKDDGASSIDILIQGSANSHYQDLAAGAGGDYRYIKMNREVNSPRRIVRVGLLRSPKSDYIAHRAHEFGWDLCTSDINQGRKGDWLHICWNYIDV